jgi:ABC-2 type transport system permease protein
MRNVFLVAKREYLEKIRSRSFRISTILVPVLMVGLMAFSTHSSRSFNAGKHIAIVADSPVLANDIRRELLADKDEQTNVEVFAPATAEDEAAQMQRVHSRAISGLLWIEDSSSSAPKVRYFSESLGDLGRLGNALNRGLASQRLTDRGMKQEQADALLKWVRIDQVHLGADGKGGKDSGTEPILKATLMALLMLMPIVLYGMDIARSIVEEKASRIFEVMLSVASADDILAGKLVGLGCVGLTQVAIWMVAASVFTGPAVAGLMLTGSISLHFTWMDAVYFPVFFVLGFLLFSALFSGLAATCETAQDLQMFMPLIAVPVWLSFGLLPFLASNPGSNWAVAGSLFPLTAPFVMMERLALQQPPIWQFALSIAILALTIWAVVRLASRLYRVGILMYGKRATLPEILRWLRYS